MRVTAEAVNTIAAVRKDAGVRGGAPVDVAVENGDTITGAALQARIGLAAIIAKGVLARVLNDNVAIDARVVTASIRVGPFQGHKASRIIVKAGSAGTARVQHASIVRSPRGEQVRGVAHPVLVAQGPEGIVLIRVARVRPGAGASIAALIVVLRVKETPRVFEVLVVLVVRIVAVAVVRAAGVVLEGGGLGVEGKGGGGFFGGGWGRTM